MSRRQRALQRRFSMRKLWKCGLVGCAWESNAQGGQGENQQAGGVENPTRWQQGGSRGVAPVKALAGPRSSP